MAINPKICFAGLFLALFIVILPIASAFTLRPSWNDGSSNLDRVNVVYRVLDDGSVLVEITGMLKYVKNYSALHPYLSLSFDTSLVWRFEPESDFRVKACGEASFWSLEQFDKNCQTNVTLNIERTNFTNDYVPPYVTNTLSKLKYSHYYIDITGFNDSYENFVSVAIQYIIPNLVRKQGDYYFAHLPRNDAGPDENDWFYFPSNENVFPVSIPNDVEGIRASQEKEGKAIPSWTFKFKGGNDRFFFYQDFKEIKEEAEKTQKKYTWEGAILGFILSFFSFSLLEFFLNRKMRCERYIILRDKRK